MKVRVRHMVVKPYEDIYPKWDDNKVFTELDNMIQDILSGQLDENFWEASGDSKSRKRNIHVSPPVVPATDDVSRSTKRKKDKEHVDGCHASEMSVKNLTGKIDGIDVSVADKVTAKLDAAIQDKVDARIRLYEIEVMKKFAILEEDVKNIKEKGCVNIPTEVANSNDGKSIAQEEDDGSSKALSWMLQNKTNSQDGLPVQCVVKKEKKEKKTTKKEPLKNKEVKRKEKKVETPLKKVKVEKAFKIPELNDESISTEGWENHLMWQKSAKCREVLKALASTFLEPTRRRKRS
ncbi:unnamed protein product [Eruca vesicaria subsp. sativa]|uniref:Uncharacterized protein n=1 Tax=Eruca vesicaria subsp. sativa TaxID=29727 RepID=A0ABC8J4Z9_ERUVS|nr:unnamed protein product [Eruca vesicaria subsp. sativa]